MDVFEPWERVIWTAGPFVVGFHGGQPSQTSKGKRLGAGQGSSGCVEDRLSLTMTTVPPQMAGPRVVGPLLEIELPGHGA